MTILVLLLAAAPAEKPVVVTDYVLAVDWVTQVEYGDVLRGEPVVKVRWRYVLFWDAPDLPALFPRLRDWRWTHRDDGLRVVGRGRHWIEFQEGRVRRRVWFLFEWRTIANFDLEVANRCFVPLSERRGLSRLEE